MFLLLHTEESVLNGFMTIDVGLTPPFFVCELFLLLHTKENILNRLMTVSVGLTICFLGVKCFYCFTEKLHSSFIFDSGGRVVVVSTDFDFSLLFKLIKYLFTIPAPTFGCGCQTSPGHINETDDIERIRHMRNSLAHNSEFEICDTDFSTHWTDLSQVK
jgi:hypothetical protein